MAEAIETSRFPTPKLGLEVPRQYAVTAQASDGRSYLLTSAWEQVGHTGSTQVLVQIALDISKEQRLVENFIRRLAGVVLLGLALSAAAGIAVARMGMRPLKEITAAAQRIGPTQLHERIGSPQWPQELTALAEAFDGMLNRLEDSSSRGFPSSRRTWPTNSVYAH